MSNVIDISDLLLRRAITLPPSEDPWADAIAETIMRHYRDAPDSVTEAFTLFATAYAEQTGKQSPDEMDWDWMWQHFVRLSGMQPEGAA